MAALADADRTKLIRVLAVILSSDQSGELTNAIRAGNRLLEQHKISLGEALAQSKSTVPAEELDHARLAQLEAAAFERGRRAGLQEGRDEAQEMAGPPPTWKVFADVTLRRQAGCLNDWERAFLRDFLKQPRIEPSAKQREVLLRIAAKCGMPTPPFAP